MTAPSRFVNGVTSQPKWDALSEYPLPDPIRTGGLANTRVHTYFNDFETLVGTDYTTTGTGTPTFALGSGISGTAVLTTTTGASDSCLVIKNGNSFGFNAGYKGWFVTSFAVSEVTNCDVKIGFVDSDSTDANGFYFQKATGSASVNLVFTSGGTKTTAVTGVTTLVANTFVELAVYYNGTDLLVFVNNNLVARVANLSMSVSQISPTYQITNSTGAARTLTLDYVLAAEEVARLNTNFNERI
jgi:hypothetical protein